MSPTTAVHPARVPLEDRDDPWLEATDPFYSDYYEAE
jgi:hypothetical protein